jgi:hypothetical protein
MWMAGAIVLLLTAPDAGAPSAAAPSLSPGSRPAQEKVRAYPLRPTRDGGYVFDDSRFRATVAPDGQVTFKDHHGSVVWNHLPFMPEPLPPGTKSLQSTLRDLLGKKRGKMPTQVPASVPEPPPLVTGPLTDQDRKRLYPFGQPMLLAQVSGTVDVTDEYYRWMGEDPYRYEKARFLAATFDARTAMAARAQVTELRRALHLLPERLVAIWNDTSQPLLARRRVLCALWTELRRDERGRDASAVVSAFVRTHAKAGTPNAYTEAELATCNEGLAHTDRFVPYDLDVPPRSERQ